MRWLVNYIRQIFCKHEWLIEEKYCKLYGDFGLEKDGQKVYMRCNKCSYHRKHWKY